MIDKQMPADAYFAHPAVNKSLLDLVGKAPSLAQAFLAGTYSREKTASMKLGSLVHALVLEPDTFSERYALAPEGDRRTKAGKEAFEQFLTESEGKDVITSSDYETAQAMAESVREHPSASLLLREGDPEVSVFAELAGTACKCRIDWLRPDGILVDLKTTKDASSSAFARSCASFDYPVQAAMYLDLTIAADVEATDFVHRDRVPPALSVCHLQPDLGRHRQRPRVVPKAAGNLESLPGDQRLAGVGERADYDTEDAGLLGL
jgi:exodeoxyribonuclease VIII